MKNIHLRFLPSSIISLILIVVNWAKRFLSIQYLVLVCLLIFFGGFTVVNSLILGDLEERQEISLALLKGVVDVWVDVREGIKELPDGKISKKDLMESLVKPGKEIQKGIAKTVWNKLLGGSSNPSSAHHERKKKLLEKARRDEISLDEARELERLLKEQKKDREQEGNVLAAIGLGLLIAFVAGVIASLLTEGEG